MRRMVILAVVGSLAACAPKPAQSPALKAADFHTELPVLEIMQHMVEPAAETYWSGWGADSDAGGVHDHTPKTKAEWEILVNGATALVEAGNSLQLEGRPRAPEAEWRKLAQSLSTTAEAAREAAERQDKAAMFEQGRRLYFTCVACHQKFERPAVIPASNPGPARQPSK